MINQILEASFPNKASEFPAVSLSFYSLTYIVPPDVLNSTSIQFETDKKQTVLCPSYQRRLRGN